MAKLSISPASSADAKITESVERFTRRVEATPPGICPLEVELSLLEAGAAQTCGKCVPCRDGLPQMAERLRRIVDCRGGTDDFDQLKSLAQMVRATSDCAIGYEAANAVLQGMDEFADEYASHMQKHTCTPPIKQKVPCEELCPAHVDVPAYIALVGKGAYADAVNMVRKDNPFPTACALVCEHPCETRCRRMLIDAPINIRAIKRTAVDEAPADSVAVPPRGVETGKRIAVIGGGASGLTCAYFSALMGHSVVVFEQNKQLGGMLRYGIPAYRFPRERLDEDIDGILKAGDITVLKDHIVRTASMREIVQTFDAVYVSIGAQGGKMMALDHADAEGVMSAVDLLHGVGDGEVPDFTGKKVAVVGGGNVAIDCARTAVRANAAEVNIVYRRRREDMPALDHEIESAVAEGVELITLEAPLGVETDAENRCTALLTQPQMIGLVKAGRPAPVPADKPERRIEADIILVAIGQQVQTKPFEDFGLKSNWGRFVTADDLSVAECEGVFVGGDCQTGPSTVIRAVAAGKVAARNIDEYLGYHHKLECPIEVPAPKANDRTPRGRVEMIERPARVRKYDYEGVEVAMSREEAQQECGRCLRCDAFGCGVLEGGRDQYV